MRAAKTYGKRERCLSRIALLLIVGLLATMIFSDTALAAINIRESFSNVGSSIGGYFNDYASSDGPQFLDLIVFFAIFFTMCWIGFNSVFKDAKNANIVLGLALGLALSVALVYGGKFTLKKLLPFAAVLLFILVFIGIYAVLTKFIFTGHGAGSKILAAVFAVIICGALLFAAFSFICSDNNCEENAFLRKAFGSESIFGRLFSGGEDLLGSFSESGPLPPATTPGEGTAAEAAAGTAEPEQGTTAQLASMAGEWWIWVILALIVMGSLGIWRRKSIKEAGKRVIERIRKRSEIGTLNSLLHKISSNEQQISRGVAALVENVKQEKKPFDEARTAVEKIATDIKETIGQEIEMVQDADKSGLQNNIRDLLHLNNSEQALIEHTIMHLLNEDIAYIENEKSADEQLFSRINDLEDVGKHFERHADIIESLGHHNLRDKNVIDRLLADLRSNMNDFNSFSKSCKEMAAELQQEDNVINSIAQVRSPIRYEELVGRVKSIRNNTLRLNGIFIAKVNTLRSIVTKLEELKKEIHSLHKSEVDKLSGFLNSAKVAAQSGNSDTACYLAWHVVENAKFLEHLEMGDEDKQQLLSMENEAVALINEHLPKVIGSISPRVETELRKWVKEDNLTVIQQNHAAMKASMGHLKGIHLNSETLKNRRAEQNLKSAITEYQAGIKRIEDLCDKLLESAAAKARLLQANDVLESRER